MTTDSDDAMSLEIDFHVNQNDEASLDFEIKDNKDWNQDINDTHININKDSSSPCESWYKECLKQPIDNPSYDYNEKQCNLQHKLVNTNLLSKTVHSTESLIVLDIQFGIFQKKLFPLEFAFHYPFQTLHTTHGFIQPPVRFSQLHSDDQYQNHYLRNNITGLFWPNGRNNHLQLFVLKDMFLDYLRNLKGPIIIRGRQKYDFLVKNGINNQLLVEFQRPFICNNYPPCAHHKYKYQQKITRCAFSNCLFMSNSLLCTMK